MRKFITANVRLPQVLVPYPGPTLDPEAQDVFLYLRPETNGVLVESLLLRVVKSRSYTAKCALVYLANMPGDFIVRNRIIEQHYALKIKFARFGKAAFTPFMQKKFESIFHLPFRKAKIIGAFPAERILSLSYEDLFRLWVPPENFAVIAGQSIKRLNDYFIVNYDIPAILHKNSRKTDFAVMLFRSFLSRPVFHSMVAEMHQALTAEKVILPDRPLTRSFHYSAGPFEQILDGIGYLFDAHARHRPLQDLSFCAYLIENGAGKEQIIRAVRQPLLRFQLPDGNIIEENLFSYTKDDTYRGALEKFRQAIS